MRLSPPKQSTFWISVLLAAVGFLGTVVDLPVASNYSFQLVTAGFVLLALANLMTGL